MTDLPPIGLSGFARSGKTTAAEYLEDKYGYTRLHIADPLRRMLWVLLRDFGMQDDQIEAYLTGDLKESIIPCLGVTSRHAQISLGTRWGREEIDPDLWANCWEHKSSGVSAPMNDSVRFPNEEQCIRRRNGFTIMIVRPDCGPAAFKGPVGKWLYETFGFMVGVHDSERVDRLRPDFIVHNTGNITDLHEMLDRVVEQADEGLHVSKIQPVVLRPLFT